MPRLRADGHRVVRLVRGATGRRPTTCAGIPTPAPSTPPGSRASTRSCTSPARASATRSGPPERKQLILESRTQGTDLLARTLAGLAAPARRCSSRARRSGTTATAATSAHRGSAARRRLPRPGLRGVGGGDRAGGRGRDPGGRPSAPGIVLAAHGGALQRMLLPFKLGLGGRLGSGEQYMSWITLDDDVGAVRHLLATDVGVGAGQPHRAEPGDQRRVHARARRACCTGRRCCRRRCSR